MARRGHHFKILQAADPHSENVMRSVYICEDAEEDAESGKYIFKQIYGDPVAWPIPERIAELRRPIEAILDVEEQMEQAAQTQSDDDEEEPAFFAIELFQHKQEAEEEEVSATSAADIESNVAECGNAPKRTRRKWFDAEKEYIEWKHIEMNSGWALPKPEYESFKQMGIDDEIWGEEDEINTDSIRTYMIKGGGQERCQQKIRERKRQEKEDNENKKKQKSGPSNSETNEKKCDDKVDAIEEAQTTMSRQSALRNSALFMK